MTTHRPAWHFVPAHPFGLILLFDPRRGIAFAMLCAHGVDFYEARVGRA